VAPDPDSLSRVWDVDPYSADFQPVAERFLCSSRSLPDVGYSGGASPATLLVQWVLWRYYSAPLALDGEYGPASRSAVESFQSSHGLVADGLVGPATWLELRRNACDD